MNRNSQRPTPLLHRPSAQRLFLASLLFIAAAVVTVVVVNAPGIAHLAASTLTSHFPFLHNAGEKVNDSHYVYSWQLIHRKAPL